MKIFISSVQKEFAAERKSLAKMIREDRWLGGFFDVFLFEECTAKAKTPQEEYKAMVKEAKKVRLGRDSGLMDVLRKLQAVDKINGRIVNGAIPLFAAHPEETRGSWEICCIQFYGTEQVKPFPALHTYNGTVFQLVDQALDFVMSHADYSVINPGCLPKGTTVRDLLISHDSNPRNHVIARAMSWTNYVEKSGSGTGEIIRLCREAGLADPVFESMTGHFKTTIWRRGYGKCLVNGHSQGSSARAQVIGPSQ